MLSQAGWAETSHDQRDNDQKGKQKVVLDKKIRTFVAIRQHHIL